MFVLFCTYGVGALARITVKSVRIFPNLALSMVSWEGKI